MGPVLTRSRLLSDESKVISPPYFDQNYVWFGGVFIDSFVRQYFKISGINQNSYLCFGHHHVFDSLAGAFNSIFAPRKFGLWINGHYRFAVHYSAYRHIRSAQSLAACLAYSGLRHPSFLNLIYISGFLKSLRHWRSFCLNAQIQNFYRHCLAVRFGGNYRTVLFL